MKLNLKIDDGPLIEVDRNSVLGIIRDEMQEKLLNVDDFIQVKIVVVSTSRTICYRCKRKLTESEINEKKNVL